MGKISFLIVVVFIGFGVFVSYQNCSNVSEQEVFLKNEIYSHLNDQEVRDRMQSVAPKLLNSSNMTVQLTPSGLYVQPIYLYASDRASRLGEFEKHINIALEDIQLRFSKDLGKTFSFRSIRELQAKKTYSELQGSPDSSSQWDLFFNALHSVQETIGEIDPVKTGLVYIIWVDVLAHPGKNVGGGLPGVAVMGESDLLGIKGTLDSHLCRWIGGMMHELSHALDVPHPPECGTDDSKYYDFCDHAIMYLGYLIHPKSILGNSTINSITNSRFSSFFIPRSVSTSFQSVCNPKKSFLTYNGRGGSQYTIQISRLGSDFGIYGTFQRVNNQLVPSQFNQDFKYIVSSSSELQTSIITENGKLLSGEDFWSDVSFTYSLASDTVTLKKRVKFGSSDYGNWIEMGSILLNGETKIFDLRGNP